MTSHNSKLQIRFYLLHLVARSVELAAQRQSDLALLTLAMIGNIARYPMRSLEED